MQWLVMTIFMSLALAAFVLLLIFVLVPIVRGVGQGIAATFRGIGWLIAHVVEFIGGMISDAVRLLGSVLALTVLATLVPLNVIIGRWSAAGHYAQAVQREALVACGCLYRFSLRRPLKLFWLHGLVEGLEERVPAAMEAAPTSDKPSKRTGQFEGYTIVGSLPGGGSGGKLYVARPDDAKREDLAGNPEHVVIKSFAITEGSSLPQIVRESRALECAKQLGHVLEHGMDEHRFYYVMPYHAGDSLAVIARQLHGLSGSNGLDQHHLNDVMGYTRDLLATLTLYHAGGFWHKDVKPDNVIVHGGRAHLVDLGLITPLKSAMTLTTHGTEYFRDPEMVRQALRGVKVHQVNGAKFDIYAAGAVLYFMIENTFPAHGGLSRFSKHSPEALRWIVRRAMAEYNQRYETAELMLADLEAVANADDPFSIKPAQLPSMKAGSEDSPDEMDIAIQTESPQAEQAVAAGAPVTSARKGTAPPLHNDPPQWDHDRHPQRRPVLRVVNWLTGQYVVDDPGSAVGNAGGAASHARGRDRAHRAVARDVPGPMGRTAREQLRAARSRARDMRRRAMDRRRETTRHLPAGERDRKVVVVTLAFTGAIFALILSIMLGGPRNLYEFVFAGETSGRAATNNAAHMPVNASIASARPMLLVFDSEEVAAQRDHPRVRQLIHQHKEVFGYNIIEQSHVNTQQARELIHDWEQQPGNAVSTDEIEDFLAEHDLYGFLHIKQLTATGGSDPRRDDPKFRALIIRSTQPGAEERRWPAIESLATIPDHSGEPFLLINDHPTRADSRVIAHVERMIEQYETMGWTITVDAELEASARKLLPTGPTAAPLTVGDMRSERLQTLLRDNDFGGLLYIFATPGDGPAYERIATSIVTVDDISPSNSEVADDRG